MQIETGGAGNHPSRGRGVGEPEGLIIFPPFIKGLFALLKMTELSLCIHESSLKTQRKNVTDSTALLTRIMLVSNELKGEHA